MKNLICRTRVSQIKIYKLFKSSGALIYALYIIIYLVDNKAYLLVFI